VSKSTASRHLNVLMAKALRLSDYSEARAVALMLKDAPASLRPVLAQRMNLFLEPLRRRLRMESPAELEISMERQYRGHAHELKLLCQALREARL
jgi:hypothetical protein